MKLIKEIITKYKNNSFLRIITELFLGTLLFNINLYLGLAIFLVVLFEIILTDSIPNMLYIFIFMAFNDEMLVLDILNGSISRILMVVIALKLIIYIIKNKLKPNKTTIAILIFFIISSLININNIKEEIIILANVFIFLLFSIAIRPKGKKELDRFLYYLFITIVTSVSCSITCGIMTVNFLEYNQGEKILYRFSGSYEPNFMCMYINVAFLSLLSVKEKINHKLFYALGICFALSAILTISITGLAVLAFSALLYFIINRKNWKVVLKELLVIILITGMLYGGLRVIKYENIITNYYSTRMDRVKTVDDDEKIINHRKNVLDGIKYSDNAILDRVLRSYNLLKLGKIDDFTSGRTALIKDFAHASFNRPVLNILFGNNPINKKVYSSFFDHDCYSHNSYADFLYNFGIIGFVVIVCFMFYRLLKDKFLNLNIKDSIYKDNVKLIRIMLMIFIFTLSMYTHRIVLLFFLL